LNKLKLQYPQLKVLLSIGGGGENSANFPEVAANHTARFNFAQSAKSLVETYGLNGIDSKTESPRFGGLHR
jgi:chitinase